MDEFEAFVERVAAEMRAAGWDGEALELELIEDDENGTSLVIKW